MEKSRNHPNRAPEGMPSGIYVYSPYMDATPAEVAAEIGEDEAFRSVAFQSSQELYDFLKELEDKQRQPGGTLPPKPTEWWETSGSPK